jgi:hypothetical protein
MGNSRRQDREKKKRERDRRLRGRENKLHWEFNAAERARTTWPVQRAWVPCPDAWGATGHGLIAVERRQPDGRFAGAFFTIDMLLEGLTMAADAPDCAAGEFAEKLKSFQDGLPPFREGPVEAAAYFAWGAYSLSVESGRDWGSVPKLKQTLALMPKPPGTPRQWADLLWNELTPDGLRRVISRAPHPTDIPEDKEVMIFTTATFDAADDPARLIKTLGKARPDFVDDGAGDDGARFFTLTRPYPKEHWSPLAMLGGRQVVGQVEVRADAGRPALVVTGKTISMTCVVIQRLKRLMGDAIKLTGTEWHDVDDLRAMAAAGGARK